MPNLYAVESGFIRTNLSLSMDPKVAIVHQVPFRLCFDVPEAEIARFFKKPTCWLRFCAGLRHVDGIGEISAADANFGIALHRSLNHGHGAHRPWANLRLLPYPRGSRRQAARPSSVSITPCSPSLPPETGPAAWEQPGSKRRKSAASSCNVPERPLRKMAAFRDIVDS